MTTIRRITSPNDAPREALAALLSDVVDGGASIGFLSPLAEAEALAYWDGVLGALGPGLALWVAEGEAGQAVGTVQLAPCLKPNGRHRAEVQKLQVHPAARGLGLASRLMAEVEAHALRAGIRLLVLDTEAGSTAERVYAQLGWQRTGEIPDYALTPDGRPHATAVWFKRLAAPA